MYQHCSHSSTHARPLIFPSLFSLTIVMRFNASFSSLLLSSLLIFGLDKFYHFTVKTQTALLLQPLSLTIVFSSLSLSLVYSGSSTNLVSSSSLSPCGDSVYLVLSIFFNCEIWKFIFVPLISKINSRFYVKRGEKISLVNLLFKWEIKNTIIQCIHLLIRHWKNRQSKSM